MELSDKTPCMPWEEKPSGYPYPVWRYSQNPIVTPDAQENANSIFNSAVIEFGNEYRGIFRCDSRSVSMDIFLGRSKDGIHWEIEDTPLQFEGDSEITRREYRYDPRVCKIEDTYYISWCNGYHGPTIGLAWTKDFETFHQMENAFLPFNRNGVLFPRKINGKFAMLSRPSDNGHTPFGDIFYSESPDGEHWGHHRYVMGVVPGDPSAWQCTKIGPGPVPIEIEEGWLLLYHGVINTCRGYNYRMGAALLDKKEPWKVLKRSRNYLLGPETLYERTGDVPNVVFPCAALHDKETGRIAVYYGAADTVIGLAFSTVSDILSYMDAHPLEL